jgi:hypothetical protein
VPFASEAAAISLAWAIVIACFSRGNGNRRVQVGGHTDVERVHILADYHLLPACQDIGGFEAVGHIMGQLFVPLVAADDNLGQIGRLLVAQGMGPRDFATA